ncbi:hypothetical protein SMACR_03508 [Sordaria macrospora]|uniref:Uncharacterized protein n=1 Tax=Sordaria macrospora TaxID=5147 RepID=A0A8S8ZF46_SORMA|nr:hypothetical protein SMACR_03508 [Sordaria macrospora]
MSSPLFLFLGFSTRPLSCQGSPISNTTRLPRLFKTQYQHLNTDNNKHNRRLITMSSSAATKPPITPLPEVTRLSPAVIRILGGNPGKGRGRGIRATGWWWRTGRPRLGSISAIDSRGRTRLSRRCVRLLPRRTMARGGRPWNWSRSSTRACRRACIYRPREG